jgi:hypothetical protein
LVRGIKEGASGTGRVEAEVGVEVKVEIEVEVEVEIERAAQLTMQASTQPAVLHLELPDEERAVLRATQPSIQSEVPFTSHQLPVVEGQGGDDQTPGPDDQGERVLGFRGSRGRVRTI